MSSNFAAKLWPYATYFLYFEVVILCLALLTLAVLLLRRVWSKQPFEGDPAYTREKIAFELTAEIARLRDLRNRIFPGFADDADKVGAVSDGPALTTAAGPEAGAVPAVDMAALERNVAKKFQERIDYLEAKLKEAEETLKLAATSGGAPVVVSDPASEELAKAKQALEQEQVTLRAKLETLEKTLMEYQIFEQDIALVKKFKTENEELRRQLSATPQVTEEDIASLFSAMTVPEKDGAKPDASAAAFEPSPPTASTPAPAPAAPRAEETMAAAAFKERPEESVNFQAPSTDQDSLEALLASASKSSEASSQLLSAADINAAFASADAPAPAPEPVPDPGFALDNAKEPEVGLTGNLNAEDLEAFAETTGEAGGQDDKIMAEFQKILGGDKP